MGVAPDPKAWDDEFAERWMDSEDVRRSRFQARLRRMEAMHRYAMLQELLLMRAFEKREDDA